MKLQTIKYRTRLIDIPDEAVNMLYTLMRGIGDKSTEIGRKHNHIWILAMGFVFARFSISTTLEFDWGEINNFRRR